MFWVGLDPSRVLFLSEIVRVTKDYGRDSTRGFRDLRTDDDWRLKHGPDE